VVDAAIKVLKSKAVLPGHLPDLVTATKSAVTAAEKTRPGDLLDTAIAENVRRQVARLKASPPTVQKVCVDRKIDIAGGVYDLVTGKVALVQSSAGVAAAEESRAVRRGIARDTCCVRVSLPRWSHRLRPEVRGLARTEVA
jgi:carbonic anhydrase